MNKKKGNYSGFILGKNSRLGKKHGGTPHPGEGKKKANKSSKEKRSKPSQRIKEIGQNSSYREQRSDGKTKKSRSCRKINNLTPSKKGQTPISRWEGEE